MKFRVFILVLIIMINATSAGDGDGDFETDTDNDPAIVIDYWDPDDLLTPYSIQSPYIEFVDIDNATDELDVVFHYTLNGGVTNSSFTMELATINYNVIQNYPSYVFYYTLPSQPRGIYMQYYYTIYDGNTTVRSPSNTGLWFDAQWGEAFPPATVPEVVNYINIGGDEGTTNNITIDDRLNDAVTILLIFSLMLLMIGGYIRSRRTEVSTPIPNDSMTKISMRKRDWRKSATGRLLRNMDDN